MSLMLAMEANEIRYLVYGVIPAKVASLAALVVAGPTRLTNSIVRLVALAIATSTPSTS